MDQPLITLLKDQIPPLFLTSPAMIRPLLLVGGLVAATLACTCRPGVSNKTKFCNSDVVALVGVFKIIKKYNADPITYIYFAEVTQLFKQKNGEPSIPQGIIMSTTHSAVCGVDWLQESREYLLNGPYVNQFGTGILNLMSCSQISSTEWNYVAPEIKAALINGTYYPCN
ncbi:hypothetical protein L596_028526 [Steinernema carpocapsae]|uniref:NTR domain-containing protein n=1 Tax=Steinernema carpocapsae TaxID=34508 RepID=A0A4U5LYR9_STECR|nr:hypothetical protein L596_028526 [Steinernema carpocapsae]